MSVRRFRLPRIRAFDCTLAVAALAFAAPTYAQAAGPAGRCDESLQAAVASDPQTTLVQVHLFKAGDVLALPKDSPDYARKATHDLCMVKLMVGPGNPGPADAPSTSKGIGIEIWLPSPNHWNGRIHAMGGGGYQGGTSGVAGHIGFPMAAAVADEEGAVSSHTDAGHQTLPTSHGMPESSGDFLMNPDGSINETLWRDFSVRAIHEQAIKTKAVSAAFYGRPARYAYWDGSSLGGRQGHKLAQALPDHFDGIIANMPAINWTRFFQSMLWPSIVIQNDLGGKGMSNAQLDLVSNAAIAACDMVGGQHMGYIIDSAKCRYDPTNDANVLCKSVGGRNATHDCVTKKQALVFNKIWYGITTDGSVPSPAVDNGWDSDLGGKRLWYGLPRGTSLWNAFFTELMKGPRGVANAERPINLGPDQIALQLEDPRLGSPEFRNARSNGRESWRSLSYAQFAAAFRRGVELNSRFSEINTDNPDLSAFEALGGKLLVWHGVNDEVIPVQGTMRYYRSVVEKMGSLDRVQKFYRLYVVPGVGHQSPQGTSNRSASPPAFTRSQLYDILVDWVEKGKAPERVELTTPSTSMVSRTQPVCPYPQKAVFKAGDPNAATSFKCE